MNNPERFEGDVLIILADEFGLEEDHPLDGPLFSNDLLDSMDVLKLINHLENRFEIKLPTFEVSLEMLDTIEQIAKLVAKRKGSG
ncbi:MAG: acyl carrier protein [Magnetococcales bacterium]|nr:acyl carrier protein [Magnetococcales bacterium]